MLSKKKNASWLAPPPGDLVKKMAVFTCYKISIDDLVQHCEIERGTLRGEVSSNLFHEISGFLTEWERISPKLGITQPEVEAIIDDNRTEEKRRIGFLKKWKQKFSIKATYEALIGALLSIDRSDDAKNMCQLLKGM